jgi:peptidoglycan/xylan/chitin deacetylase (PgdA/CDA1 family)
MTRSPLAALFTLSLVSFASVLGCASAPHSPSAAPIAATAASASLEDSPIDPVSAAAPTVELASSLAPPVSMTAATPRSLARCATDAGTSLRVDRMSPKTERRVALTFDDGPHVTHTPSVLDLLEKHSMHATFFVVGRAINDRSYGLVQRAIAEGHVIGSHSYDHEVGMAADYIGEQAVDYVVGEHVTTQALVDLAVVATSAEDFDALYQRVFDVKPFAWIMKESIRTEHEAFAARTHEILDERGVTGRHAYEIGFYRPPGGGPYLGSADTAERRNYDEALGRLGLVNVLWHGGSGDTDADRRHDMGYLLDNLAFATRQGGVILVHDAIDKPALANALDRMDKDGVEVVPLETIVREDLGC